MEAGHVALTGACHEWACAHHKESCLASGLVLADLYNLSDHNCGLPPLAKAKAFHGLTTNCMCHDFRGNSWPFLAFFLL